MKKRLLLQGSLTGAAVWLLAAALGTAAEKPAAILISVAPSKAFSLEVGRDGGPLWIVPAHDPGARLALPTVRVLAWHPSAPLGREAEFPPWTETTSDQLTRPPLAFISPDDRWIFVVQNLNVQDGSTQYEDQPFTAGFLYHRVPNTPNAAPRYELAAPGRFDTLAMRYLAQEKKMTVEHVGEFGETGISKTQIEFAAWSADSARLMVALSCAAGDSPADPMISQWLCYFNTRTGAFERTERLRASDVPGDAAEVLHAESVGQEGPDVLAKERFAHADAGLNDIYGQVLKQLAPAARTSLRQEQRAWIDERDTFASVHALQSWSPFTEASELEGKAISTEARTAELRKRLAGGGRPNAGVKTAR